MTNTRLSNGSFLRIMCGKGQATLRKIPFHCALTPLLLDDLSIHMRCNSVFTCRAQTASRCCPLLCRIFVNPHKGGFSKSCLTLYCQSWRFVSAVLDGVWSCRPYVAIVYFTFGKVGVVFQRGVIRLIYCFVRGRSAQGFHIQYLIMLAREVGKQRNVFF